MIADKIISFEKTFEFMLLPEFIKEQYPQLSMQEIEDAIARCMRVTKIPRTEEEFVTCVKIRLGVK